MPRQDRSDLWRQGPLLAGLLLAGGSALAAIAMSVEEPAYEAVVFCALMAGITTSALGLRRGRPLAAPGAIVMLAAFSFFALRFVASPLVYLFYPPEILAHEDLALAAMIGWLLVAFSFWQSSRANLIFLLVAGLAIFGLTCTINLNVEMRFAFALFVVSAVFCWSYEQFLDMDDRLAASGQPRLADWPRMARAHVSLAVFVGLLTFGLGSLVGTGAYRVSPNLYASMARQLYGWSPSWNARQIFNSFGSEFSIGTGPVRLLPLPVLEITADHPALWRGAVYDFYDGHGWKQTSNYGRAALTYDAARAQYTVPGGYLFGSIPGRLNRQEVTVIGPTGLLIAAAQPETLTDAPPPSFYRGGPAVDVYGCLSSPESDGWRHYVVTSREPISDPDALRAAGEDYEPYIQSMYMNQPAGAAALKPLVTQWTEGTTAPYDRVMALQTHLQEHCLYSLDAPAIPRGEDAVAYFVLKGRRGACDMFASALAVMARLAGVPARVATGYQVGEFDRHKNAIVVRGTDAHAWAEIYFPRYGWVAFDPQAAEQASDLSMTELLERGHWRWVIGGIAHKVIWVVGVLMIALIAMAAVIDPIGLARQALAPRPRTPIERLSREYLAFYQGLLRRHRVKPDAALTPQEAIRVAIDALHAKGLNRRVLLDLNERFYKLRYDEHPPAAQVQAMRQSLRKLRKTLR